MKRRLIYGFWFLLTVCLYFFENNMGTRCILLCTFLLLLVPRLRTLIFSPDHTDAQAIDLEWDNRFQVQQEEDEPGCVRDYHPGDPVNRIHWKLSAKRNTLLVRENEKTSWVYENREKRSCNRKKAESKKWKRKAVWICAGFVPVIMALLVTIPAARRGLYVLANTVYDASEQLNAYAYIHFPVDMNQSTQLTSVLIGTLFLALAAIACLTGSRIFSFILLGSFHVFQIYFGLPFPALANIGLYVLFVLSIAQRPWTKRSIMMLAGWSAAAILAVLLIWPGVHETTETASEWVRDQLSKMMPQVSVEGLEQPYGMQETRHVHPQTLSSGEQMSGKDREYRLVTIEKEPISIPYWVNYLKIALLLILTAVVMVIPFLPFVILDGRRKKALQAREIFQSEQIHEAVQAIFQLVVSWLEGVNMGPGNSLYRTWTGHLEEADVPEGYAERFEECAIVFEKAVYSDHPISEDDRKKALELLGETEEIVKAKADWKQRLHLKYWECLWI